MKRLLYVLVLAGLCFTYCSSEKSGVQYGNELTLSNVTKISTVLESPTEYEGKKLLIEGRVLKVCENKGCWMEIAGEKELTQLRVKVEDGVITFPLTAIGSIAKVEGTFAIFTQTVEQQMERGKHQEEETGEKFDPSTITGPKVFYQLQADGAVIN
ncbi:MAG: DUF4920 domain-containing protein [bacterium]|nr:DUF4920 domain-containing protein [bacterium]